MAALSTTYPCLNHLALLILLALQIVGILNNFLLGLSAAYVMVGESKREVLGTSTITRKAQVTVPKKVRDRFKLKEGDLVMFIEMNDRLYIAKSTEV